MLKVQQMGLTAAGARAVARALLLLTLAGCASPHRAPTQSIGSDQHVDTLHDVAKRDDSSDASDASDASDDSDDSAAPRSTDPTGDAGPVTDVAPPGQVTDCFVGAAPGPMDTPLFPAKPTASCPGFDEPFIGGPGNVFEAPELQVELGVIDPKTGAFEAFNDGDFVGIFPGGQPGFHVWIAFRVTVPGATAASLLLEIAARGLLNCKPYAYGSLPSFHAKRAPGPGDRYIFHHKLNPGMPVICQDLKICKVATFCGAWLDVRLQVHRIGTAQWGRGRFLGRVWDGVTALP